MDPQTILSQMSSLGDGAEAVGKFARLMAESVKASAKNLIEATKDSKTITEAFNNAIKTDIGQFAQLAFRLTAVNSSIYGTTEAFTSVIPVIDAVKGTFDKLLGFASKLSGALPLGPISAAARQSLQLFSAGIGFLTDTLKFQIESAQKLTNSFLDIAKNGATFGASLVNFATFAREVNVPMQLLSKITKDNLENFNKLGLNVQDSSKAVIRQADTIFRSTNKTDQALAILYGGIEGLTETVGDFATLLAQEGTVINENTLQVRLQSGAVQEYLLRQKELTSLTGQSTKALKEAEEKRRNELDYTLKMSRLTSDTAKFNVQEGISLISKMFGTQAGDVAKEFFATDGNLYSLTARQFSAVNAEVMEAIENVLGGVNLNVEGFRNRYSNFFTVNADRFRAVAEATESIAEVNRAANNTILGMQVDVGKNILASQTMMTNATALLKTITDARNEILDPTKPIVAESAAFLVSLRAVMDNQKLLDQEIMSSMGKLGSITTSFLNLQASLVQFQGMMFKEVLQIIEEANQVPGGVNFATEFGKRLAEKLGEKVGKLLKNAGVETPIEGNQQPPILPSPEGTKSLFGSTENPLTIRGDVNNPVPVRVVNPGSGPMPESQNPPERAAGGVTTGPSLAGEDGPEAVIPLKYGDIPLKIDWTALTSVMQRQAELTEELVSEVRDSKNVQEKILAATY